MRWALVGLLAAILSTLVFAEPVAESGECQMESLRLTMVPKKSIDEQLAEYQPLSQLLSEGLNLPVELVRATSYESVMDSIVSGAVDIAVLGPASYILAHRRNPRIEAFASLATERGYFTAQGSFYHSILIVNEQSKTRSMGDLRGSRVALTDPASTSGALVPKSAFADHVGSPFDKFFGVRVFSGSHDKAMDALIAGEVKAAFVSSARADEYLERGKVRQDTFRVLWRSQPLHYDPFVFRAGLCPKVRGEVIRLMTTSSADLDRFLENQHASGVHRVSHRDYEPISSLF